MICKNCEKELNDDFKICPYCGQEIINIETCNNELISKNEENSIQKRKPNIKLIIIIAMVALVVIVSVIIIVSRSNSSGYDSSSAPVNDASYSNDYGDDNFGNNEDVTAVQEERPNANIVVECPEYIYDNIDNYKGKLKEDVEFLPFNDLNGNQVGWEIMFKFDLEKIDETTYAQDFFSFDMLIYDSNDNLLGSTNALLSVYDFSVNDSENIYFRSYNTNDIAKIVLKND